MLAWQISAEPAYDPDLITELEVTFTITAAGGTRVDLEHRHLDRYGTHAAKMLGALDSANGWRGVLDAYVAVVSGPDSTGTPS